MIEVNVKEKEKTVEKIDFPVLMKSVNDNQIVLFTSKYCGVLLCIENVKTQLKVGDFVDRWISCFDLNHWKKYEGEITLKNK